MAINEKQTGPLTLEKVKEHWDRGEISPDSLCWRAGYDDWMPVSEVKMLNSVLAPQAAQADRRGARGDHYAERCPAVMNVPVQSAFSAGGMVQTVQSQMQVPMSAGRLGRKRRTAGSRRRPRSLGSLLKDEMDAQAQAASEGAAAAGGGRARRRSARPARTTTTKPTNGATVLPMPIEGGPSVLRAPRRRLRTRTCRTRAPPTARRR